MYLDEDMPIMRSSHWQIPATPEDDKTPAHPADQLFAKLHEHVDPAKVVLAAHCGGRYADIRAYHDEALEPLVEVMSCWGVFEWLLWDAFDAGYRVGVVCNSDGHKGRPGAEGPGAGQFGIFGGLTCLLAPARTRAALFDALKSRRCYGTTGPRMDLSLGVNDQTMGAIIRASGSVLIEAAVRGVGPIECLELFRGRERLITVRGDSFSSCATSRRVRLTWGGARIRGRGRRATWDPKIRVTGATIERVEPFAFDSPLDGVEDQGATTVSLRSRTTGDIDGVDLWLDQAQTGEIVFESGIGGLEVDLENLDVNGESRSFGGLALCATIRRYPEQVSQLALDLNEKVELKNGTNALWVKATQVDGHMAWASPIYVERED